MRQNCNLWHMGRNPPRRITGSLYLTGQRKQACGCPDSTGTGMTRVLAERLSKPAGFIERLKRYSESEIEGVDMIKPLVPYAEWSSKYQILPDPVDCPKCLAELALTIPIAVKGYRGLRAEACKGCGDDSGIARFVPVDRDKVELWEMLRPNSQ